MWVKWFIVVWVLGTSSQAIAQQYNFEKLATDLFSVQLKTSNIAITTDSKSSGVSSSNAKAIEEAVTTAIQRKAASQNHSVIAAAELAKIYDYRQFTGDRSDFAELAEKLKADLLVSISIQRLSPKTAQVSGKLLGVSGNDQGKILNASKVYEIPINSTVRVAIEGVFENNERREKLDDNVLIGLSNVKSVNVVKAPKSRTEIDYAIRADISWSVEDVRTKEAQGAELMSQMLGDFQKQMGGDTPLKGMSGALKNAGKAKVATVIAKMSATEPDGRKIMTEHIESKTLPPDISDSQLRSEVGTAAKISIKTATESLARKISEDPNDTPNKAKSKSMFD
jgi:hypothetical protein